MIKLHDMRNNGASTSKFVKDRCFMKIHHYSDQLKDSKGKHSRQDPLRWLVSGLISLASAGLL